MFWVKGLITSKKIILAKAQMENPSPFFRVTHVAGFLMLFNLVVVGQ